MNHRAYTSIFHAMGQQMNIVPMLSRIRTSLVLNWQHHARLISRATKCRLAFCDIDAVSAFAWLHTNYEGPITLVHLGFPTPFPTRIADNPVEDGTGSTGYMPAVHRKPDFMVQVP